MRGGGGGGGELSPRSVICKQACPFPKRIAVTMKERRECVLARSHLMKNLKNICFLYPKIQLACNQSDSRKVTGCAGLVMAPAQFSPGISVPGRICTLVALLKVQFLFGGKKS